MVARRTTGTLAGLSRNNTSNSSALRWFATNEINTYILSPFTHQTLSSPNTNHVITTHRRTGNNIDVYLNNTITTNSRVSSDTGSFISLGNANGSTTTGQITELIFWNQDYDSLLPNITQEINNYYGIY